MMKENGSSMNLNWSVSGLKVKCTLILRLGDLNSIEVDLCG